MEEHNILDTLLNRKAELQRRIDDPHTPESKVEIAEYRLMEVQHILTVSGFYARQDR